MNKIFYKILLIIVILPIVILSIFSFCIRFNKDSIVPSYVSIDRLLMLLKPIYLKLIISSILISFISAVLAVILALPAAYAVAYYDFKYKNLFLILTLVPILVPPYAYFMGLLKVFNIFKINDTIFGVILSHAIVIIPYGIINIKNAFLSLGKKYEEMALTFKDNIINRLINITLPLMKNTIIATISLGFTISFSQYFLTLLVGGGKIKTYALYVFPLIQGNNRALASIASLFYILINAIFLIFICKTNFDKDKITL